MIDRTQAPAVSTITSVEFSAPKTIQISEHTSLFHMAKVPNETARFDLYFDAGKVRGKDSIPTFVNGLLFSGTPSKTAVQLEEEINALGGFMETGISVENSVISIYCLNEKLPALFKVIFEAITEVHFDADEVADFLADRRQKLNISREKVSYLAQSNFQQLLFASEPSYGAIVSDEDFDNVTQETLREFHEKFYLNGLQHMVIVGDIEDADVQTIAEKCALIALKSVAPNARTIQNEPTRKHVSKDGALQSAIRVGRTLFNKNHSDYLDFLVVNTLIGDYFGSRLMSNIREDKGYTYGIGSMVAEFQHTGYFLIATEVGKDVLEAALNEIKYELERLQNEPVSEEELELVRNYMRGQLLKSADGPYAMTDLFLSVELQGFSLEFYNDALAAINAIRPERIQELAQRYLKWEDMTIVTAG